MKKLLFVYNPRAGKEMLKPRLSDVLDIFVKAGYEVTVHPTQAYRDAYYQIKEYEVGKYDLIACSGGDGTIDEVATGMMKRREMGREFHFRATLESSMTAYLFILQHLEFLQMCLTRQIRQ